MQAFLLRSAAAAILIGISTMAAAEDLAKEGAKGAASGGSAGGLVGGPTGATSALGIRSTVGEGIPDINREHTDHIVVEERTPVIRERTCVTDAAGTIICEEIYR